MKYLLIISCLLFASVCWSKDVSMDDLVEREGLYYEKFKGDPFTGKISGQKQGKISKGKREGKWIKYFENGQFLLEGNYKDGKKMVNSYGTMRMASSNINGITNTVKKRVNGKCIMRVECYGRKVITKKVKKTVNS